MSAGRWDGEEQSSMALSPSTPQLQPSSWGCPAPYSPSPGIPAHYPSHLMLPAHCPSHPLPLPSAGNPQGPVLLLEHGDHGVPWPHHTWPASDLAWGHHTHAIFLSQKLSQKHLYKLLLSPLQSKGAVKTDRPIAFRPCRTLDIGNSRSQPCP